MVKKDKETLESIIDSLVKAIGPIATKMAEDMLARKLIRVENRKISCSEKDCFHYIKGDKCSKQKIIIKDVGKYLYDANGTKELGVIPKFYAKCRMKEGVNSQW
jgi:hypothetical protein